MAKLLKASEVAKRLGAAHSSVRKWCKQGKFPNAELVETVLGPVWLIPESDLKGFIKRGPGHPPKKANKASSSKSSKQ
jgi:predicted site-specific integrase-resolvase